MKPVAIITATPPGVNPGMLACDAAARTFMARAGLTEHCTFFRVRRLADVLGHADAETRAATVAACDIGLEFSLLEDASQLEGMTPVFWGDFLHMHAYQRAVAGPDPRDFLAIADLLLLRTAAATTRRAVSYGTSILFNATADYGDPDYGPAFRAFFDGVFHVQMRDAISAAVVSGLRRRGENNFGIDPAQLLSLPAYESAVIGDAGRDDAGTTRIDRAAVFFARGKHDWRLLEPFIDNLATTIGVRPAWIPWGDSFSFPFMHGVPYGSSIPRLPADRHACSRLQSLLRTIRESRCVITDTYHLAVISWAIGVPAVVIAGDYHDGEKLAKAAHVRVRHDKRKVIMGQDGLLDFYIEPQLIAATDHWKEISGRLGRSIHAAAEADAFRSHLAARATASEASLLAAIRQARTM